MASVHKDPRSRYWHASIEVWDGEKWRWRKRSTKTEDYDVAIEMARTLQKAAHLSGPSKDKTGIDRDAAFRLVEELTRASGGISRSWKACAEEWLSLRSQRVKPATEGAYRSHLSSFAKWLEDPHISVERITLEMAQRYYDELASRGLAPKTLNNNIKTLAMVVTRAVSEGVATRNPWEGVERRYGASHEREPFTMSDVRELIKACEKAGKSKNEVRDWRTMIHLGLCTGARLGDCLRMSWVSVEGEHGERTLSFAPAKKTRKGSEQGRMIRIPVIEPLDGHLESLGFRKGPLCPTLADLAVSARGGASEQFRELVNLSGISLKVIPGKGEKGNEFRSKTFHSFRHTLNSLLLNQGVPDEWRMKILDHESKAVNRGYSHADIKAMRAHMGAIDLE